MISIYHNDNFRTNCKPELLAFHLNEMFKHTCHGMVDICDGRNRFRVNAKVARELAYQFICFGACDIQVMGESLIAENEDEFINIFRKVKTERLILNGAYIQSTAETFETAFREVAQ